ncbi:MAG: hypothetical protein ACRCT2_14165 [Plesiomonas shigelloides]
MTEKAREAAMETGMLPHQWLLMVARGEPVPHKRWKIIYDAQGNEQARELVNEEFYPDFATRVDAAKAAAPFYAPKLAVQTVSIGTGSADAVTQMLKEIAERLPS